MKGTRGFTLLELLMVVVIIAILASLALPQYIRTAERARMSEAITMLGSLRSAAVRFHTEVNPATYVGATINSFDVNPTDVSGNPNYAYDVAPGATADCIIFTATRNGAAAIANCVAGYVISEKVDGTIQGRDCQSAATILTCP